MYCKNCKPTLSKVNGKCVNLCPLHAAAGELLEALQAITFAAITDCPQVEAWKILLHTCIKIIAKAGS